MASSLSVSCVKELTTEGRNLLGLASLMIKNECQHTVSNVFFNWWFKRPEYDIEEQECIIVSIDDIQKWIVNTLFGKIIRHKVIPKAALESMYQKGIKPKKQPTDNVIIFIVAINDALTIATYIPTRLNHIANHLITHEHIMNEFEYGKLYQYTVECVSPFRQMDIERENVFQLLRENGIISQQEDDTDSDVEMPNLNDLSIE